jgi:hypothetical protein
VFVREREQMMKYHDSDESKKINTEKYLRQRFSGCEILAKKCDIHGRAPYYFQISKDSSSLAIVFIQQGLWDDETVLQKFHKYDLINYIKKNTGCSIIITPSKISPTSD